MLSHRFSNNALSYLRIPQKQQVSRNACMSHLFSLLDSGSLSISVFHDLDIAEGHWPVTLPKAPDLLLLGVSLLKLSCVFVGRTPKNLGELSL